MENYKKMLDQLLKDLELHIDADITLSIYKEPRQGPYAILATDLFNLTDHEFALIGCKIKSYHRMLKPFEDYLKKNNPEAFKTYNNVKGIYELFERLVKSKTENKKD